MESRNGEGRSCEKMKRARREDGGWPIAPLYATQVSSGTVSQEFERKKKIIYQGASFLSRRALASFSSSIKAAILSVNHTRIHFSQHVLISLPSVPLSDTSVCLSFPVLFLKFTFG